MLNIKTTIFFCIYLVICACGGVDVSDPQAGYFDDHTDKSGTQNFNNNGMGTMEVNINYNNGSPSTTIIPSQQTVNTTAKNYIIDGISFELIDNYLYLTNLSDSKRLSCDISYRGITPETKYAGMGIWDPQEVEKVYIGNNKKNSCIIITALICKEETKSSNGFTGIGDRSKWTGYSELCETLI